MKRCKRCKQPLPFHAYEEGKAGLKAICRNCLTAMDEAKHRRAAGPLSDLRVIPTHAIITCRAHNRLGCHRAECQPKEVIT